MPPSDRLDAFIELEEKLSVLRVHFEVCEELKPSEVLEWAKFFLHWSKVVAEIGGPNAKKNFLKANKLFSDLFNAKPGYRGYEALDDVMEEAQGMIQEEIFDAARPRKVAAFS